MTDQEFIRGILRDDKQVLGRLYETYREACLAWMRSRVHKALDEDELVDIYTDACLAVWDQVQKGRLSVETLSCSLKTYLFTVAKNMTLRAMQGKKSWAGTAVENIPDGLLDSGIEDAWMKNEEERIVYEEVCKMPFPCNRLLNLFYFQKKRGEEIAQIMNYSGPDSVKTQKSKCMRKIEAILRKRLGR